MLTARDGFQLRFAESVPIAQQPEARLNSTSPPTTDQPLGSLIADAMRQLPFDHRAVIYRAYYLGWTTPRIADDLKITEAAVKLRLHDGLRMLNRALRRSGRGEAP